MLGTFFSDPCQLRAMLPLLSLIRKTSCRSLSAICLRSRHNKRPSTLAVSPCVGHVVNKAHQPSTEQRCTSRQTSCHRSRRRNQMTPAHFSGVGPEHFDLFRFLSRLFGSMQLKSNTEPCPVNHVNTDHALKQSIYRS